MKDPETIWRKWQNGGPAFPAGSGDADGMTMRQWYKGMAMMGYNANPNPDPNPKLGSEKEYSEIVTMWASDDADAQIAEDKKHEEEKGEN